MTAPPTTDLRYKARRLRQYAADLWHRREFAWFLALGNFKARNASTTFGLFWWVLNPLLLSLVYFLIFGLLLGTRDLAYLMSGMFVFHFTAQSLTGGANSILQNSKLLANIKFPRLILPLSSVLESGLGFVVSLGVLLVLAVPIAGSVPGPEIALLALVLPLQLLFNVGLGSLTARLAVPFRDINNLIPYISRIWLYTSPIIWPLSFLETDIGRELAPWVTLNPMFSAISVYRTAMLGYPFDPQMLLMFTAWALAIFLLGVALFVRYETKIVRYL